MKLILTLSLLLLAASPTWTPVACAEDTAEDKIKKALSRKVTFEFVDTPFTDALEFVRRLANVALIIDPKVMPDKEKLTINLRVNDMELDKALQWIVKLAELEFTVRNQAIFITSPPPKIDKVQKKTPDVAADGGVLRAHFATGDGVEVDAAMLRQFPHLAEEIMALGYDPGKDEILALAPGHDIPPNVPWGTFVESAKKIAPDATFDFDDKLNLLYVRSKDESDLRHINAIARALRRTQSAPTVEANVPPMTQTVTLKVTERPLKQVLDYLATIASVTVNAGNEGAVERFKQPISLDVKDTEVKWCFELVSKLTEMRMERHGNTVIFWSPPAQAKDANAPVKPPRPPEAPAKNAAPKNGGEPDPIF